MYMTRVFRTSNFPTILNNVLLSFPVLLTVLLAMVEWHQKVNDRFNLGRLDFFFTKALLFSNEKIP